MNTGTTLSSDSAAIRHRIVSQCAHRVATVTVSRTKVIESEVVAIDREKRKLREVEQFSRAKRQYGLLPVATFFPDLNDCLGVHPRPETRTHDQKLRKMVRSLHVDGNDDDDTNDEDGDDDDDDDEIKMICQLSSVPKLKLRMRKSSSVTFVPTKNVFDETRNENINIGLV